MSVEPTTVFVLHENTHYVAGDVLSTHRTLDGAIRAAAKRMEGQLWEMAEYPSDAQRSWERLDGEATLEIIEQPLLD